jgi:hypothetical protein
MSMKTDRIIFGIYITVCVLIFALFGCVQPSVEARSDNENLGELVLVAKNESHVIWRYYDNQTGALCYVTDSSAISCEYRSSLR